jgi:hypothetical protein
VNQIHHPLDPLHCGSFNFGDLFDDDDNDDDDGDFFGFGDDMFGGLHHMYDEESNGRHQAHFHAHNRAHDHPGPPPFPSPASPN